MLVLLSGVARAAQPTDTASAACDPVDEPAFRSMVLDAQAAVDRGDVELSATIVDEAVSGLPCLTFAPAPRMWADLLVALAIVEFSRGGDWQAPMTTALQIRPMIDRGVASGHPLAAFEAPPAELDGPEVPAAARIHVDGLPATTVPTVGLHLVQRTDGRFWNTLLLSGEAPPSGWMAAPVDQPPRIAGWATAGGVLGLGSASQETSWSSDWIETRAPDARAVLGGAVDGAVTFYSPFGLAFSAMAPVMRESPGWDARVAGIWTHGGLLLGGGLGTHGADTYAGDGHRVTMIRYGFGVVHLRVGGGRGASRGPRWDLGLVAGGSGAIRRAALRAGVAMAQDGPSRWRVGLDLDHTSARFVQSGAPAREVTSEQARLLLQVGMTFGEY